MRRRQFIALGAAAGIAGCVEDGREGAAPGGSTTARPSERPTTTTERPTTTTERPGATTSVGGSVHGRAYRLGDRLDLLERSETDWLHAFLDVPRKHAEGIDPREDPDVQTLRRAKREHGVNLYVSLQWNFIGIFGERRTEPVPDPGSSREQDLLEYATALLRAIGEPVDYVGLGNEPLWETRDVDLKGEGAPLYPFTRNVTAHVTGEYTAGDPTFILGAFNRLYSEPVVERFPYFYEWFFEYARTEDAIDGIDLHVHYATREQAENMVAEARRRFPEGIVTATEFSPIWRYDTYIHDPFRDIENGPAFAEEYGVDPETTVTEYLEAAKHDRLPREEMAAFMSAMPWYKLDFVQFMHDVLAKYDASVGTFGFLVEDDVANIDWTDDWAPFPINCLFQPALIATEDGAHPHYLDDFQRLARAVDPDQ